MVVHVRGDVGPKRGGESVERNALEAVHVRDVPRDFERCSHGEHHFHHGTRLRPATRRVVAADLLVREVHPIRTVKVALRPVECRARVCQVCGVAIDAPPQSSRLHRLPNVHTVPQQMHGSGDLAIVIRREGINAFGKPIFPRVIRGGHNCIRTVPQRALEIPEERGLFCLPLAVVEEPLREEREREREREREGNTRAKSSVSATRGGMRRQHAQRSSNAFSPAYRQYRQSNGRSPSESS